MGDLSTDEGADLAVVVTKIEAALGDFSAPGRMNYLMLMMVDAHVHFHVLPRYADVRDRAGQQWRDPSLAGAPRAGRRRQPGRRRDPPGDPGFIAGARGLSVSARAGRRPRTIRAGMYQRALDLTRRSDATRRTQPAPCSNRHYSGGVRHWSGTGWKVGLGMSGTGSQTTLDRGTQQAGTGEHRGGPSYSLQFRGPRPPDAELRALRGIAYALILVLPFWLAIAWMVAVLVWPDTPYRQRTRRALPDCRARSPVAWVRRSDRHRPAERPPS